MAFVIGVLCGVVAAIVVWCVWMEILPNYGVEKPTEKPTTPQHKHWTQTHNFLYYDGTVMPEIKEDNHEQ